MSSDAQQSNKSIATLNYRLTSIMKKRGITISELSKKAMVAVGTIQKLMNDPRCNPTIGSLESICNILDVTISELIGEEHKLDNLLGKSIYIFSWEDVATEFKNIKSMISIKKNASEFIKTFTKLSDQSFGLKMKDESMLPIFHKDCILIFDSEKQPYSNSFVLVKLKNYTPLVCKQLLIDEPFRYIKSMNPILSDNLTKLEKPDEIIATLVEAKIQY